jgi:hypothetical protein
MEEADLLAGLLQCFQVLNILNQIQFILKSDRKAIITNGKFRYIGSSFFLKNKFGVFGYHLKFVEFNFKLCSMYNLLI